MLELLRSRGVFVSCLCSAVALAAVGPSKARASFSAFASADVTAGQNEYDWVAVIDGDDSSDGSFVEYQGSETFGDEETGEMTITGSASASAGFGMLRTSASGTLFNPIFDESLEPLFNADGSENPGGMPTYVAISAQAGFTDVLQYGGTATDYNSKYILRLTGSISGDAFHVVTLKHGNNTEEQFIFFASGNYDQTIVSDAYVHGGSPQTFKLTMQSTFQGDLEFGFDGQSGSAAFGNTLEVLGVELRDEETGELLSSSTITSATGGAYVVREVPEPGSLALLGLGVLAMLRRKRRNWRR